MQDKKYKEICDKLGFDLADYEPPPYIGTEDDRYENPFSRISLEEKLYLYDNGYLTQTKK